MECNSVTFSGHAIRRMFERNIARDEVVGIVHNGETIADYPDDQPYPSRLLMGLAAGRPIHVVVAYDQQASNCYVVTAYPPDPQLWDDQFKKRRS